MADYNRDFFDDTFEPLQVPTSRQRNKKTEIQEDAHFEVDDDHLPQPEPEQDEVMAKEEPKRRPFFWWIHDRRLKLFFGIVLMLLCAYVLVATFSYFYNLTHDQSAVMSGVFDASLYANTAGPLGAWIAHFMLYNWLGLGSLVVVFYLVMISLKLLGMKRVNFWKLTFRCLIIAIAASIILGFVTYSMSSPIYWGGRHGHFIIERLMQLTGLWGALGVTLIMAAAVLLLFFNRISALYQRISARWAEARERARQSRLEARAQEEEIAAEQAVEEPEPQEEEYQPVTFEVEHADPESTQEVPADSQQEEPQEEESQDYAPLFGSSESSEISEISESSPLETPMEITVGEIEQSDEKLSREEKLKKLPPYDPRADLSHYRFPGLDLLIERESNSGKVDAQEMEENKQRIIKTLADYGIPIQHIRATVGATVTLYEIIPAEGVRIAKIKRLEDDIAMSLSALGIRIIAPIPGKGTIGIEVPNKDPQTVPIRAILGSKKFRETTMDLPMAMGTTISNEVFMADLCKMPHLLVAGATGMGKSVGLNTIIACLLYKKHPAELKFVLVDPKMVEFSLYAKIENHYLAKLPDEQDAIITDPAKVVATLNSLCVEMDNRYALLKDASIRNIKEYNDKFIHRRLSPEHGHRYMPYIVVIVDEFADLIMTAGKEVETPIARIAQKARAVGIHMILATQRPSTNVITGIIKANFPGRIAFRVFQMVDSRTILDRPGANQLIGRGDMLFSNNGKIDRVQCAFIDTPEVESMCDFIANQVSYGHAYELPEYVPESDMSQQGNESFGDRDPLFDEAARLVVTTDTASTSSLQRRYSIGYNRAGKIMDQMEAAGIVGPSQGGKPRKVLVDPMTLETILGNQ